MIFYTTEEYFKTKYDASPLSFAFSAQTQNEYAVWKKDFRILLSSLLGFEKMILCPPNIQELGAEQMDGYTRYKLIIDVEPAVKMPFYLLKPDGAQGRLPVVFALHGHSSNGKNAVCGIDLGDERLKNAIKEYNYSYGVSFVKQGFLVFCPDARGFGERAERFKQDAGQLLDSSCANLNAMAYPLGMNVTGMWTWDLMQLLDYALTRDDVDASRINSAGLSGGGLQTLWFAAMDERVQNAVISGYFYGYKQSLLEYNYNCSCNYVPRLWEYADMGDIAALIANRGVLIETGDEDPLNGEGGLSNVRSQFDILIKAAALLNNTDSIVHHVFHGGHRWNGEKSIPWIAERNFQKR